MWFPNRFDTNRAVQSQKRARSLKFRIYVEEELYCPSSENKGADQLRGYREADLRLCFCLCRLLVFPRGGSNTVYLNVICFRHKCHSFQVRLIKKDSLLLFIPRRALSLMLTKA